VEPEEHAMLTLSIVIVSWNVAELLERCLESIDAALARPGAPDTEIIVVDSASSDDTVRRVHSGFPHVRLISLKENLGYVRGNNIGVEVSAGQYILLLNPDTEILDDALAEMVSFLNEHPEAGIVGPHTLNTDGTHQSTRRRFPTLLTGIFESTWLQPLAPRSVLDAYYVRDVSDDAPVAEVDWVQGSALMTRREVFESVGFLDDGYVMYSEELDWCRRARLKGWKVYYLGTARIIHHGGQSTAQAPARTQIHFHQSKLRYFRKFHGKSAAQFLRVILLLNYTIQLVIEALKHLLGHKRALRRERIHAYLQVLRSRLEVT
jgi:GT2 family glycosyltransferase